MDIYKYAVQHRLRFPTNHGSLTVEQLFDLKLITGSGFDLDSVAKSINNELKVNSEESFVSTKINPNKKKLEIALEIVKDVIATKQKIIEDTNSRLKKSEERRKILDAMSAKHDHALSNASMEELEKKLAALDDVS